MALRHRCSQAGPLRRAKSKPDLTYDRREIGEHVITGRRIKLLKLEAEGAEPEVIQGCDKILADIEFIAADLGEERGKEQESTMAPVINYVLSRNFEIISINAIRGSVLFKNKAISGGEARHV